MDIELLFVFKEFSKLLSGKPELFLQKNKIIRMGHPPMRLEISTGISGVEFEECYASRIRDIKP